MAKTRDKQSVSLEDLVEEYLTILRKDRDRYVLSKRHALRNSGENTLESIGKELGITRERVRQIEKAALEKVIKLHSHQHNLSKNILKALSQMGGLITFEQLLADLDIADKDVNNLLFLIRSNPAFIVMDKNDQYECIILDQDIYCAKDIYKLHDELVKVIKAFGSPQKLEQIIAESEEASRHNKKALHGIAKASRTLNNLDQAWGLSHWPTVNPKSIRDKVYLAFKKANKPLHFTEIADSIKEIGKKKKDVTLQAVHNELIKDDRFVLIGRGIYALREWGYSEGTVSDIIVSILKEEAPLSKDEIARRVLSRRQVQLATVILNLQDKNRFARVTKGVYTLK